MTKTEIIYGLIVIVFGAQGFWQFFVGPWVESKRKKPTAQDKALIGLLYEQIYNIVDDVRNAWEKDGAGISRARYEHIVHNLLEPYHELGGNSDAEQKVHSLRECIDDR